MASYYLFDTPPRTASTTCHSSNLLSSRFSIKFSILYKYQTPPHLQILNSFSASIKHSLPQSTTRSTYLSQYVRSFVRHSFLSPLPLLSQPLHLSHLTSTSNSQLHSLGQTPATPSQMPPPPVTTGFIYPLAGTDWEVSPKEDQEPPPSPSSSLPEENERKEEKNEDDGEDLAKGTRPAPAGTHSATPHHMPYRWLEMHVAESGGYGGWPREMFPIRGRPGVGGGPPAVGRPGVGGGRPGWSRLGGWRPSLGRPGPGRPIGYYQGRDQPGIGSRPGPRPGGRAESGRPGRGRGQHSRGDARGMDACGCLGVGLDAEEWTNC